MTVQEYFVAKIIAVVPDVLSDDTIVDQLIKIRTKNNIEFHIFDDLLLLTKEMEGKDKKLRIVTGNVKKGLIPGIIKEKVNPTVVEIIPKTYGWPSDRLRLICKVMKPDGSWLIVNAGFGNFFVELDIDESSRKEIKVGSLIEFETGALELEAVLD